MLDNFVFENHLGQRFIGRENGVYLNYNDLRDYSWSYEMINDRIARFYRPLKERSLPLVLNAKTEAEALAVKNKLMDLADADVEALRPGKIFVGDYYTNGYITGSAKSNYLITKCHCNIDLTFSSEDPAWYREQLHSFFPDDNGGGATADLDYPYDYPHDYAVALAGRRITCGSVGSSAFRLLIYGAAIDPAIVIGGHTYAVNGAVKAGETLEIDSLAKRITLTDGAGRKINWFDNRGRNDYIFEPIPPGQNMVSYTGDFGFDLTIIEKRSEPRWT